VIGLRWGFGAGALMVALGAWVVVDASNGGVLFGGVCMLAGGIGWSGYLLVFTLKTAGKHPGADLFSILRTDAARAATLGKIGMLVGVVGAIVGISEAVFAGAVRSGLYTACVGVLAILSSLAVGRRQRERRRRSQRGEA